MRMCLVWLGLVLILAGVVRANPPSACAAAGACRAKQAAACAEAGACCEKKSLACAKGDAKQCDETAIPGACAASCKSAKQACAEAGTCREKKSVACTKSEHQPCAEAAITGACGETCKTAKQECHSNGDCPALGVCPLESIGAGCEELPAVAQQECTGEFECCIVSDDGCSACSTQQKLEHALEAARHLQAAGMTCDATRVLQTVQTLRRELLNEKLAQLERLQAEIRELRQLAGRQVMVHTKIVEVSVSELRKVGFNLQLLDSNGTVVCDQAKADGLIEALSKAKLAKVISAPTIVTGDGRPAFITIGGEIDAPIFAKPDGSFCSETRSVGTKVDFAPHLVGENAIRLHVRPQIVSLNPSLDTMIDEAVCPGLRVAEAEADCEMELGKTLMISGPVHHIDACCDTGDSSEARVLQTIFLFTPEVVNEESEHRVAQPLDFFTGRTR